mgnify:CR=1 FL=1
MPLIKDNIVTTLRTKDKNIRVDELLTKTEILSLITNETAVHNAGYKPDVITSIKTTNQTNVNSLGSTNDFVLLVGQTTSTENGLYEQTGTTTTTKQTVSSNTFYVEKQTTNELRAIFNESISKYIQVYNTNFNINHTLAINANTAAAQTVFELPTLKDKPSIINLDVFGHFRTNKDNTFSGSYKTILVYDTDDTDDDDDDDDEMKMMRMMMMMMVMTMTIMPMPMMVMHLVMMMMMIVIMMTIHDDGDDNDHDDTDDGGTLE